MLTAGMHRKPIPDLIIASVAQHHDAVLVHHDRDFDDIAAVATGLPVPDGSLLLRHLPTRHLINCYSMRYY